MESLATERIKAMDDLLSYLQRYTERHHHKRVESLLFTLIFTQLLLSIVLAHADPCERLLKLARTVVSAVQGERKQGQADVDAAQDEVHVDVFLDIEKERVPKVSCRNARSGNGNSRLLLVFNLPHSSFESHSVQRLTRRK